MRLLNQKKKKKQGGVKTVNDTCRRGLFLQKQAHACLYIYLLSSGKIYSAFIIKSGEVGSRGTLIGLLSRGTLSLFITFLFSPGERVGVLFLQGKINNKNNLCYSGKHTYLKMLTHWCMIKAYLW